MAPPPSTTVEVQPSKAVSRVLPLIIRVITFIFLLVSVIIISTTTVTSITGTNFGLVEVKVKFSAFYAYRYMLATGVIGMVYTLLQIAFTIFYLTTGNRFGGDGLALVDFYGDKAFSYMLATGAAAGFGLSVDLNRSATDSETESFTNKANAAASLLFIGFIFSAISSVFSSFSLPKKAV